MGHNSEAKKFAEEGYAIHVTGRNVLVTDAMKDYAIDKISKIERFSDRIIDVYVTMDIQKIEHRIDIVLKVDQIKIKGQGTSTDMYVSVDQAVEKIKTQLRKYRTKIREHQDKGVKAVDMVVNVVTRPEDLINEEIEEENQRQLIERYRPHEIVSQETRPLKELTHEEAVMKMELSTDSFLIFRNEASRKLEVIYRRADDHFGIIEIEKTS